MTGGDRTLRAALAYARIGWPVFPCRPGEKAPATSHGFLDATTDPERVVCWWTAAPGRNVAIATGAPGPDVLDVDVRPDGSGFAAFNELKRAGMTGHPRLIVRTPSGGMHAYYAGTAQRSGHLAARHIDFRGQGGYVVAPPSAVSGRPYVVISRQPSEDVFDWSRARELLDPQSRPGPERRVGSAERAIPASSQPGLPLSPWATGTPGCSGPPAAPSKQATPMPWTTWHARPGPRA